MLFLLQNNEISTVQSVVNSQVLNNGALTTEICPGAGYDELLLFKDFYTTRNLMKAESCKNLTILGTLSGTENRQKEPSYTMFYSMVQNATP